MAIQFPQALDGVSPLPHLGLIRVTGTDAASFLHNQLTQDVLLLPPQQCRLAAFCNAKGRMQASFVLYKRSNEEVLMVCPRELIAPTIKRLSMFVLRAKAKLSDATADYQLFGLAGHAVAQALQVAEAPLPAWQRVSQGQADVLTLYPALGQPRALWIAPQAVPVPSDLAASLSFEMWQMGEVMSGIAWVLAATWEAFVPQMLNYESVDGVSFKKGCYPGQEVVARSQFRGTLKRRAFLVQADAPMVAGQEVFSSLDATQPCGLIAQVASAAGQHVAIAELQLSVTEQSATANASLRAGSAQEGPLLTLLPLPYPLRDDL